MNYFSLSLFFFSTLEYLKTEFRKEDIGYLIGYW